MRRNKYLDIFVYVRLFFMSFDIVLTNMYSYTSTKIC